VAIVSSSSSSCRRLAARPVKPATSAGSCAGRCDGSEERLPCGGDTLARCGPLEANACPSLARNLVLLAACALGLLGGQLVIASPSPAVALLAVARSARGNGGGHF
jgi:hypothetical protein